MFHMKHYKGFNIDVKALNLTITILCLKRYYRFANVSHETITSWIFPFVTKIFCFKVFCIKNQLYNPAEIKFVYYKLFHMKQLVYICHLFNMH